MTTLYSASQARAIDQAEITTGTPGFVLMERAGKAAFDKIIELWPECDELIVICGAGNNAGDGYIIAALAQAQSYPVRVFFAKELDELKGDARSAASMAERAGVSLFKAEALNSDFRWKGQKPVIIDALLGTGFSGDLSPAFFDIVQWMNSQGEAQDKPVFSIDLPSGIYADTGAKAQNAVNAKATISFIGHKKGLFTGVGKQFSGDLFFDDLLVSDEAYSCVSSSCYLLEPADLRCRLVRSSDSHKGRHGHVAVVGGREGTSGAGLLAAEASLRSGAGLTSLFTARSALGAALTRVPEVMTVSIDDDSYKQKLEGASVICLGPGLGLDGGAVALAKAVLSQPCVKILDADVLTLIANSEVSLPKSAEFIMTPHPGEAARMLSVTSENVQKNRFSCVEELHSKYGGVVVLKGAGTIVYDGDITWVCDKGNPGMAVGGMGDVLSGVLSALVAQGLTLIEAARLGVWAHSFAADIEAEKNGQLGLVATDLLPTIRHILNGKAV